MSGFMMAQNSLDSKDLLLTCIKAEGIFLKFWALSVQAIDIVKNFERQFLKIANTLDFAPGFITSDEIPVNSVCVVKSKLKNMWCRARVTTTHQGVNAVVQLIDYGNEEVIHASDVRKADQQLTFIPAQALEFILADVESAQGNEWSPESLKFCEQHLLFQTVSCYVVSSYMKLPVARLAIKGEKSPFVQRLINRKMAVLKNELQSMSQASPFKINSMDLSTTHLIKISCVENLYKFYVQLSVAEMELKKLMDAINKIPIETLPLLKYAAINTPCLALNQAVKPSFCRALITSVQDTHCKVFYVDYGFTIMKEIHELRAIPNIPGIFSLAAQAISCSLSKDTSLDINTLKCLVNTEHLQCQILNCIDQSYNVKLSRKGQDIELNLLTYPKQKLHVGTKYEVIVSYFNNLKDFYVQLINSKEQQNTISSILNSNYNYVPVSFMECTPGKPVCAKFSQDNQWYRAQVVTAKNEIDISVFFVDFGNNDNVSLNAICNISPDVLKFPVQAFKCYLVKTIDDNLDLFNLLTTDDQSVVAHVLADTEESSYGLAVSPKNSAESSNEKILSLAPSIPEVSVNDIESIYVTSFETMSSFFAQFEKLDSEELLSMQEEINLFYASRQNTTFSPKKGDLVCARFPVDNMFYRAKVEKCVDESCDVFFIDYGNKETIAVKDVHSMDIRFTKFSQFGTQCALNDAIPGISDHEMCELMLENSLQVKMVRQQCDKWFVSLTDNYANNDSVLQLIKKNSSDNAIPHSIHDAGNATASKSDALPGTESTRFSTQTNPTAYVSLTTSSEIANAISGDTPLKSSVVPSEVKHNKFLEVLSSDFEKMYDLKSSTDCVLKAGNEFFPAHRIILSARSSVFEAMFNHSTLESSSGEVDITDIHPETLRYLLRYIYSGKIQGLNPNTAASMYTAANKYALLDLKEECFEILMENLNLDNICDAAELANAHAEEELEKKVVIFIKSRFSEIMDSINWKRLFVENPLLVHKYLSRAFTNNV